MVASREWGSYPILSFREVPVIEVMTMPRPGEPPLGAGESSSVPGTAAIANAIFDATGVRFRQPPFTPEVVRAALNPLPAPSAPPRAGASRPSARRDAHRRAGRCSLAALRGAVRRARAPLRSRARSDWSAPPAGLAPRHRAGDPARRLDLHRRHASSAAACSPPSATASPATRRPAACPMPAAVRWRRRSAPIYGTNLTPDVETGIGAWSFSAFQRAMREGISRDGHRLYPAFPYTAFTQTTDDDLTALYAYLMAQPAVRNDVPPREAGVSRSACGRCWRCGTRLFLTPGAVAQADPQRSAQWNRGAYLVNGLGPLRRLPHRAQRARRRARRPGLPRAAR